MIADRLAASRLGWIAVRLIALGAAPFGALRAQSESGDDGWNFDEFEDAEPTLLELAGDQALDIGLFAAFATLAMVSFLRKSVPLKYVTLVASVLYMGFYKSQLMSIVNIFSTLTGNLPIFSYSMAWYAFAAFTVITTVFWGRLYCGRICAFGALTQLIDAVVPSRFRVDIPQKLEHRAGYIKYGILFGAVGYYLVTREIQFYRYIEPFWMFTLDASIVLWIGLGVLLVASVFVRNLYCRFLCPFGAALGLVSALTVFKIKRWSECNQCALCEKKCEWGAIRNRQIIMPECVRCDDCEILYDDKQACPHWLLEAKRKARLKALGAAAEG
ncbi:4Fe-4S binding protein [Candidatus Rariloculus sp.]|uniref:4Fe-4S binding protein n=1 Tax=Candidatus Rariloculus sp. TaxID=3101265 RepID=UPI003D12312D